MRRSHDGYFMSTGTRLPDVFLKTTHLVLKQNNLLDESMLLMIAFVGSAGAASWQCNDDLICKGIGSNNNLSSGIGSSIALSI